MTTDLTSNINNLQAKYGFPLNNIRQFDFKIPQLTAIDQRLFSLYQGNIINRKVILVATDKLNVKRTVNIISKVQNSIDKNIEIVLVVDKLNGVDRKELLKRIISFITLDGEFFLPSFNIQLHPSQNRIKNNNMMLSTMGQKLFMFILMDMIAYEKKQKGITVSNKNFSRIDDNEFYRFKGGADFLSGIGKTIGINNRVSFNRAITDLISHKLIKSSGETINKEYYAVFNSEGFFKSGEQYLQSPIKNKEFQIELHNNPTLKNSIENAIISGNSALSKVTMLAYDGPTTYVVPNSETKAIPNEFITEITPTGFNHNNLDNDFLIVQVEKYDLKIFNKIFTSITKYPSKLVDPLHLYLMFCNSQDDRILGEIDDLLDKIWSEL